MLTCCQEVLSPICCQRDYSSDPRYYGCFFRPWSIIEAVHSTSVWRTCPGNRWVTVNGQFCKCVTSTGEQIDPATVLMINANGWNDYTGQPIGNPGFGGAVNVAPGAVISGAMSGARSRQICADTLNQAPSPSSSSAFGSAFRYRMNSTGTSVVQESALGLGVPILPPPASGLNNGFPEENIVAASCGVSSSSVWATFSSVSSYAQKSITKVWGPYNISKWSVYWINNNPVGGPFYLWVRTACTSGEAQQQGQFIYSEDSTEGLGLDTMQPRCTELGQIFGQLVHRFTNIQKDVACSNLAP